ncbi:MAG: hypothetical protein AAGI44_20940, partial [Pseudomonadota bacterium]
MIFFRLSLAFALASFATPTFAQSNLDRCAAATPQFPEACPCVIERAQAAGITGSTLSRLLSNDTQGVPIDLFQQYGVVYVQCIQDVVMGSVGTRPPLPPVTSPEPVLPTPQPSVPESQTPQTPALAAPVQPAVPAANVGQWTLEQVALRQDRAQPGATVFAASGRQMRLFCNP